MRWVWPFTVAMVIGGPSFDAARADGGDLLNAPGLATMPFSGPRLTPEASWPSWPAGAPTPYGAGSQWPRPPIEANCAIPSADVMQCSSESNPLRLGARSDQLLPISGPPSPPSNPTMNGFLEPSATSGAFGSGPASGGGWCDRDSPSRWYGYAGGLIMTRDQPNKVWTTYRQPNIIDQVLNTDDAGADWAGGAELTLGYRFSCNCGLEVTYWGVWDLNGSASVSDAGNNLGTPMDVTTGAAGLLLGGQTPDSFFNNAHEVFLWRHDEVDNVEINWTYDPCGAGECARLRTSWLAGVRLFKFDESLLWTSVAGGFNLGDNGGADQASLKVHCENDLAGFQVGANVNCRLNDRLSIFAVPKMGIFGTYAESESRFYRGDGIVGFDIVGHKDVVSMLGSFDLGLNCDIGPHWSIVGGYRVVAVSGIALADNQIPHFLAAANEFADVKTNGDLILHGAFGGISFRW
jgi:hypothetical protein